MKVDHPLAYKTNLTEFKKIQIIEYVLYHNENTLEIFNRRITGNLQTLKAKQQAYK